MAGEYVIRCRGWAVPGPCPYNDQWLVWADLENPRPDGSVAEWGALEDALRFQTPAEAIALWSATHPGPPVRLDGRPNRPLTIFHIEVENTG